MTDNINDQARLAHALRALERIRNDPRQARRGRFARLRRLAPGRTDPTNESNNTSGT